MMLILLIPSSIAYAGDQTVESSFGVVDTTPPAAVTDLSVIDTTTVSITLRFTAPGDDGAWGEATQYDIRCAASAITTEAQWNAASQIYGEPTPGPPGSTETFTTTGLRPSSTYWFALKTADNVLNWSSLSNTVQGVTKNVPISGWGGEYQENIQYTTVKPILRLHVDTEAGVVWGQIIEGGMLEAVKAIATVGGVNLPVPKGVRYIDSGGNAVDYIKIGLVARPDTTSNLLIMGPVYSIQPTCTFDPSIEVWYHYDPKTTYKGLIESDLAIAYYDYDRREWVAMSSAVNIGNGIVSTELRRSSVITLLAPLITVTRLSEENPPVPASPPDVAPTPIQFTPPTPEAPARFNLDPWAGISTFLFILVTLLFLLMARLSSSAKQM